MLFYLCIGYILESHYLVFNNWIKFYICFKACGSTYLLLPLILAIILLGLIINISYFFSTNIPVFFNITSTLNNFFSVLVFILKRILL